MDETKIEPHDGELESYADKTESENSVHAALGRLTNQRLHSTAIIIFCCMLLSPAFQTEF